MTDDPISVEQLSDTREAMVNEIVANMSDAHRRFLLSFEAGAPDWQLLSVKGAAELPAVKWRQHNLDTLPAAKRRDLVAHLEKVLAGRRDWLLPAGATAPIERPAAGGGAWPRTGHGWPRAQASAAQARWMRRPASSSSSVAVA